MTDLMNTSTPPTAALLDLASMAIEDAQFYRRSLDVLSRPDVDFHVTHARGTLEHLGRLAESLDEAGRDDVAGDCREMADLLATAIDTAVAR